MNYIPPRYVVHRLYRRTDGVLIYVGSTGGWGLRMSDHVGLTVRAAVKVLRESGWVTVNHCLATFVKPELRSSS